MSDLHLSFASAFLYSLFLLLFHGANFPLSSVRYQNVYRLRKKSKDVVFAVSALRVDVSYFNKFDHVDIPRPCWRWPPAATLVFYYPIVSPPSASFASRSRRPALRAAGRTTLLRVAREGYGMLIQPGNLGQPDGNSSTPID